MIPTTPWEVPFTAIARWLGIQSSSDIEKVCPNIVNFDSVSLADPESMMSNSITTPTQAPTATLNPSWISSNPSKVYSSQPSNIFSTMPSLPPSGLVSSEPSTVHSILPSLIGSPGPSIRVSSIPSMIPSFKPSVAASLKPTEIESFTPSEKPSIMRSDSPSVSIKPTELPSSAPVDIQNVALAKPAIQSSDASSTLVAGKAVDGNNDTLSRTKLQKNPFWVVSLKAQYKIATIKLTLNQWNLVGLKSFKVQIKSGRKTVWRYTYKGKPRAPSVVLDVPETTPSGSKVKIFLKGKNRQLELQEVEVIGIAV